MLTSLIENTCWAITGRRPISGTAVITELIEKFKRSFEFHIIAKVSEEQLILKRLGSSHLHTCEVTPLKFQRNLCMNNSRTRCQHFLKCNFIFRCRKLSISLKFVMMKLGKTIFLGNISCSWTWWSPAWFILEKSCSVTSCLRWCASCLLLFKFYFLKESLYNIYLTTSVFWFFFLKKLYPIYNTKPCRMFILFILHILHTLINNKKKIVGQLKALLRMNDPNIMLNCFEWI